MRHDQQYETQLQFHLKHPTSLLDFLLIFLVKFPNSRCQGTSPSGSRADKSGQTDGQADTTKPTGAFRVYMRARPKSNRMIFTSEFQEKQIH
jgi:hypothetical protein